MRAETKDVFEVGDVVRLKSGGPAMTVCRVEHVLGTDGAVCCWFPFELQNHSPAELQTFPLDALKLAD